ncbi:putative reverse transcriptase domain-containing protein [Tanacetum coccineum]
MRKTRADYGSGVARPKIEYKDNYELKGQFLKELRANTFSGSDHEDANEHIEKVLEIVDLFHIPNITIDQVMLRAFPISLPGPAIRWLRNKPSGPITTWEDLKTKFLSKYCPPARTTKKMEEINNFQQILDSSGAIPSKTVADAKVAIQEMAEYSLKWHNGTSRTRSTETSDGLAAIQAQLNNLRREIKKVNEKVYVAQVGGRYRATALGFYQRNNTNPSYRERRQSMEDTLSNFMSELAKIHEEKSNLIKEIRALTDVTIRNQIASIKTLEIQIGQMSKVLHERGLEVYQAQLKLTQETMSSQFQLLSKLIHTQYAVWILPIHQKKGSYGPQFSEAYSKASYINNSIPRKEKDPRSVTLLALLINVCFDNALADLGASISVMPLLTYLNLGLGELAHIKLTVELADSTKRPNDLMPTIKEGEVVEEFRARNDARMVSKVFGYPSDCDHDKKIRMDCAYNLKFSCMIDFAVLEDMDAYHDEGMGDVIFGEPFLRKVRINAKWFEGMISIQNGNEEVTYQMVRSHPKFKHHTNEQCNKIPPLLKGTDIQQKDEKQSQKRQNQARNGKDKVKSKPKSVKVKKSIGKSTPTKSKVIQVEKIQLEGLKLPNLKLCYKNKKTRAELANWVKYNFRGQFCQAPKVVS